MTKPMKPQFIFYRLAVFVAFLAIVAMPNAFAETRALIIGVDTYKYLLRQQWLKGAVNDANDIAGALKSRHVGDLTVLTEQDATRSKVIPALDAVIERVQRDDLVILAFSGHGISEVWGKNHPPNIKEGDRHETFLLAKVALPNSKGVVDLSMGGDAADRLTGTELNQKFVKLNSKGARIIFVADACHGGGGTRRFLASEFAARSVIGKPYADGQDPLAQLYASLPTPVDPDTKIPNLTLLAAVDRHHSVREIPIPQGGNEMRGALSYSFARLIDGTAKIPEEGQITRRFLFDYISATVRSNAANDQDPDLQPRLNPAQVVMKDTDFSVSVEPTISEDIRTVRIRTEDGPPVPAVQNMKSAFDIVPVESGQSDRADLSYVTKTKSVYSTMRDLISDEISPNALLGVAEREYAIRKLLRLSTSRPLELSLDKSDRIYFEGEDVRIQISDQENDGSRYYTLINIAGTGSIQVLYPIVERHDNEIIRGITPFGHLRAAKPFGSDMFVLVTSSMPMKGLISALRDFDDGTPRALDAVAAIEAALNPSTRIGLQGFYTARSKFR